MLIKNKKGILWSELAKWVIVLALIVIIILAIIEPTRKAMFAKLTEFFTNMRFGV